jgi:hypothetical protein
MIPPQVWKAEICNGLDSTMVARTLAERGMLQRAGDGFQPVRKRVYLGLEAKSSMVARPSLKRRGP